MVSMNTDPNSTASSHLCSMTNEEICKAIALCEFAQFSTADMTLMYHWLGSLKDTVVRELSFRADSALTEYTSVKALIVNDPYWKGGE